MYVSGFFDAMDLGEGNYDREYLAADFAHYFSLFVANGVFPQPSTGLQVKASAALDLSVSVSPGNGWINGYYLTVLAGLPEVLQVPPAHPSLPRVDSILAGWSASDRKINLYIKSGTASATPSPVDLVRNDELYEIELAQISMSAGAAGVTQAMITDKRFDTARCGIVAGLIDQIDTTDLFAQYDAALAEKEEEFNEWFANLQGQLSGDVAANLQNQINQLSQAMPTKATKEEAISGIDNTKFMTPALTKYAAEPIGSIKISALDDLEEKSNGAWMQCDGRALAIEEYPELFAKIRFYHGAQYTVKQLNPSVTVTNVGERLRITKSEGGKIAYPSSTDLFILVNGKKLSTNALRSSNWSSIILFFVEETLVALGTRYNASDTYLYTIQVNTAETALIVSNGVQLYNNSNDTFLIALYEEIDRVVAIIQNNNLRGIKKISILKSSYTVTVSELMPANVDGVSLLATQTYWVGDWIYCYTNTGNIVKRVNINTSVIETAQNPPFPAENYVYTRLVKVSHNQRYSIIKHSAGENYGALSIIDHELETIKDVQFKILPFNSNSPIEVSSAQFSLNDDGTLSDIFLGSNILKQFGIAEYDNSKDAYVLRCLTGTTPIWTTFTGIPTWPAYKENIDKSVYAYNGSSEILAVDPISAFRLPTKGTGQAYIGGQYRYFDGAVLVSNPLDVYIKVKEEEDNEVLGLGE